MQENEIYKIDVFDYDLENDSLFFKYKGKKYKTSTRIDNIILDLGVDGSPVGAEILNASKMFKVPKSAIKNLKNFYAEISISKESIEMKFTISVVVRNHKTEKFATSHSINDVNIPSVQIAMAESF
jgi:uncharacterized protein YuzE